MIIRGGENIPVAEIESLLYKHPNIATVALVAYADERMSERACAIIKLKDQTKPLSFNELVDFLKTHNLAMQYLPERLEIWDEIPMTPSGKSRNLNSESYWLSILPPQRLKRTKSGNK